MYKTLIDTESLHRHLGDPDWIIVDCRFDLMRSQAGREAYLAGHIPGALYADLNQDLSAPVTPQTGRHPLPDPEQFAEKLGTWGIGNASQVIVYDAGNGGYAVRLWWLLRWLGHEVVALLDGGFTAWQAAGYGVNTEIPQRKATRFTPTIQWAMNLTTEDVRTGLAQHTLTLVDARAPARYAGEVEPIDPVAGHIPDAINIPYEANMDAQGRFLSASQLRARFAQLGTEPGQVVHMCGSGVTACHNILVMEHVGLIGSRLYAGSWSEWVRDPKNRVKKGYEA